MIDSDALPGGLAAERALVVRRSLAGFLRAMIRNPLETLPPEVYHHGLVRSRIAGHTRLYVCDPALIQEGLVGHADALSKGRVFRRVLGPALGNGLLTAEGADWRRQRRSAAPAFQHARLLDFLPAMIAAAEVCRDRWRTLPAGAVIDIGHEMMLTTFAIIVDTMLSGAEGIDVDRIGRSVTAYLAASGWAAALAIAKAPTWTPYPGRVRAMAAAAFLRGAVRDMVVARRAHPSDARDLVALLLAARDPETGHAMSDGDVADNLVTFVTAGHETTAQGLAWTLHLLADHPAIEARLLAEITIVTGGRPLRPAHVASLVYTRQVFFEAMRLYPPAPLILRRVDRTFVLGGEALDPGSMLIVPIVALHRHARLWRDPARFDPDRFAPAQAASRHRYAYLPFGAGPRNCIGNAFAAMEAVAILAVLLPAFALANADAQRAMPTMQVTLRPVRPIRMALRPRRGAA